MIKNQYKKIVSLLCAFALCLCVGTSVFFSAGVQAEEETETEIVSACLSEDGETLIVDATLSDSFLAKNGACGIFLFEFKPYEKFDDINTKAPVSELVAKKELSFTVDLAEDIARRKYSKYILAVSDGEGYAAISGSHYIDNPEVLATERNFPASKTGKAGILNADTEVTGELGVSKSIVRAALNELVSDSVDEGQKIDYAGKTYYVDKEKLITLDNQIRTLSEQGIEVYVQLVLTAPVEDMADAAKVLYASSESKDASFYALDTTSEQGTDLYCALVEFLADRYTRDDHAFGHAPGFIFGCSVNDGRGHYYMGPTNATLFISSLSRAVRLTSWALRSVSPKIDFYVSFGNNFQSAVLDPAQTPSEELDFSAKQVMDGLVSVLPSVPFGFALSAGASDGRADFWTDPLADNTFDTPFITMKNIELMAEYIAQPAMLCGGFLRDVIISDFRVSAGDSTISAQSAQAAALVCAYYKAYQIEEISALFYGAPFDTQDSGTGLVDNGKARLAFTAFQNIGALGPDEIESRMETYMDEESFAAISQGDFSSFFAAHAALASYTGKIPERSECTYLANFTDNSLYGFGPDAATASVHVTILNNAGIVLCAGSGTDKAGIVKDFDGYDLAGQDVLNMTLMAQATGEEVNYTLTLTGKKGEENLVLSTEGTLSANEWHDLAFEIAELDTLTNLSLRIESPGEEVSLLAKDIRLYRFPMAGSALFLTILIWVAAIILFLFLILYIRYMIVTSRRAKQNRLALAKKIQAENNQMTYRYNRRAAAPSPARPAVKAAEQPVAAPPKPQVPPVRPKSETRKVPEMPKTEPKVYVVPPKQEEKTVRRATLSLGIEPVQQENTNTHFNTTEADDKPVGQIGEGES
ncbi:MAG: hypothetical protein HFE78_06195 [Clostridiales bacterium]|nr:hypothetical protein [Clostridiales bacterium]